jgi:RND family efflux transporter MFP subunit
MKRLFIVVLVLSLVACSQEANDEESIRKEINTLEKEKKELESKIKGLEEKLEELTGEEMAFSIPVAVKMIDYEQFNHYFEVRGLVEAINESFISPEINGRIVSINVKEGDRVRKGQLLASLDSEITQNNIDEVRVQLEHAETVYQKQKRLWDKKIGSEIQYLNAKNTRDNLQNRLETLKAQKDMTQIKSPIDGVVDDIFMKAGEIAMPGRELMRVVNLQELYVNADVSESYLASVSGGDLVELSFPVYPEIIMEVPVFRIGNVIDPENRTFRLQLKINNQGTKLKPNILSIIRINDFSSPSALVVPSKVIKQDMNGYYLYVVEEDDNKMVSRKVYIETGMSYNDETMVFDGLDLGDRVIIEGFNQVSDGSPVSVKV